MRFYEVVTLFLSIMGLSTPLLVIAHYLWIKSKLDKNYVSKEELEYINKINKVEFESLCKRQIDEKLIEPWLRSIDSKIGSK